MSCISVRNLTKRYGKRGAAARTYDDDASTTPVVAAAAVDNVTFEVKQGEVFGFLGPNGAGKSTTIKLLTTLLRPTSGSITVLGIDAVREPLRVRQQIGVVLQQPSYEPTLSVEKALDRYGMMWGVPRDERRGRIRSLLEEFDLHDIRSMRNEDLSIGQRRRVQVAREFMHDMRMLFLDEPTVGLDPAARRDLLDYLRDKVDKTGLSIFYTTHILTEAEYLCDEIGIMNRGRLVEIDTPDALKARLGAEKTIRIHLSPQARHGGDVAAAGGSSNNSGESVERLLSGVRGCRVSCELDRRDGKDGGSSGSSSSTSTVTIRSSEPELALLQVLGILRDAGIRIDDLSAAATSLEDIFLDMTDDGKKKKKTDDGAGGRGGAGRQPGAAPNTGRAGYDTDDYGSSNNNGDNNGDDAPTQHRGNGAD